MTINPYKPPESRIKNTSGYNFLFDIDDTQIHAGGSSYSGKEYVYINDQLVSSQRSYRYNTGHEFHYQGIDYQIQFSVVSALKGEIECRLYRNHELVQVKLASPYFNDPRIYISILLYIVIYVFTSTHVLLPWWAFFVGMTPLIAAAHYFSITQMRITEIEITPEE